MCIVQWKEVVRMKKKNIYGLLYFDLVVCWKVHLLLLWSHTYNTSTVTSSNRQIGVWMCYRHAIFFFVISLLLGGRTLTNYNQPSMEKRPRQKLFLLIIRNKTDGVFFWKISVEVPPELHLSSFPVKLSRWETRCEFIAAASGKFRRARYRYARRNFY